MEETIPKKKLPECTIARAGRDLFSSRKDLTVIMIPCEKFSPFAKAVDDLYKAADVPFNLIIVEGNAPDSVRASLEKKQRKHKNITILYSNQPASIGAAVNLAAPHLKTPYAFIMDNDVRIPRGSLSIFLRCAKEKGYGIICPQNFTVRRGPASRKGIGVQTCFMITRDALQKLGKFDEKATPLTLGIDIRMAADEHGIPILNETATSLELDGPSVIWPMDAALHSFQWNEQRVQDSLRSLEQKWGICLPEQDYVLWLERKKQDLADSKNLLLLIAALISKIKLMKKEKQRKDSPRFTLPKAA